MSDKRCGDCKWCVFRGAWLCMGGHSVVFNVSPDVLACPAFAGKNIEGVGDILAELRKITERMDVLIARLEQRKG